MVEPGQNKEDLPFPLEAGQRFQPLFEVGQGQVCLVREVEEGEAPLDPVFRDRGGLAQVVGKVASLGRGIRASGPDEIGLFRGVVGAVPANLLREKPLGVRVAVGEQTGEEPPAVEGANLDFRGRLSTTEEGFQSLPPGRRPGEGTE